MSPSDGLHGLLERFLLGRSLELAPASMKTERLYTRRFAEFCRKENLETKDLCWNQLARYFRQLPPLSRSYRAGAMRAARRFCVWAHRGGHVLEDLSGFPVPKDGSPLPMVPSAAAMLRLLEVPDTTTAPGLRDRLVLELLYVLGLRAGECCRLDLEDLDLFAGTLRVQGKGGYERLLPTSPGFRQTASSYLERSRPQLAGESPEPALVLSRQAGRISYQALRRMVKRTGEAVGLTLHPHLLRHAFATHLMEAGMETRLVQELLGHRSLVSTTRYTHISPQELRREFFRCHPRARVHPDDDEEER